MKQANAPTATYRVQFNKDFRFVDCGDIVPYLHTLGIGALYSSPRFRARRGSSHGYDVASPMRINSELGTEEEFDDLCGRLRRYGLGLVLDIVPNHMAASSENPWWMDVLENGPSSPYAHYFDIDWRPAISKAAFLQENRVLLPRLGDLYGNVLKRGELTLGIEETGLFLRYFDHKFPLDPATYGEILAACLERMARDCPGDNAAVADLERARTMSQALPPGTSTDAPQIARRLNEARAIKRMVFEVYRDHFEPRAAIEAALREISEDARRLDALLEKQAYRLAFWKTAFEEINYRRFFDINDLVCLRVEEEDVFAARHKATFQLIADGKVTGLRVDHIDGLYDPQVYLERLQEAARQAAEQKSVFVAIEKILGWDEDLPRNWKTCGTTGYDFLNAVNGILIDLEGLKSIEAAYARFTGSGESFVEICYTRKKLVMRESFIAEVQALGHHLGKLAAQDWCARDVPLSELIAAMVEITACLPVYRTYIRSFEVSRHDQATLKEALEAARRRTTTTEIGDSAFAFLGCVLLLDLPSPGAELRNEYLQFVMRWQQFTGPVMAKGVEDTAGYVHSSLISISEVGSDALREHAALDVAGFHRFQQGRLRHWPHSMNATSTHDTKRSEDVRARIDVLSELPAEWEKRLFRWRRMNQRHRAQVDGIEVPTPAEESLLYQTLLGAWPFEPGEEQRFVERLQEFLTKAVREAKVHSGWIRQNEPHEKALLRFAAEIPRAADFREDFLRFQRRIAWHGALNSLSQVLIKITAPGLPDFYQGSELWDLSMVDPDNRRPVDYRKRIQMLEELRGAAGEHPQKLLRQYLSHWQDGRIKLYLIDRALDFRGQNADMYSDGEYMPLEASGAKQENVCAFARHKEGHWGLTIAIRLTTRLAPSRRMPLGKAAWGDTVLRLPASAPQAWKNSLTGGEVSAKMAGGRGRVLLLAEALKRFPVALLGADS